MTKHLIHRITWDQVYSGDAYLYGTRLTFTDQGALFENQRMASGKLISRFHSATNYQGKRTSPALPLLVPGTDYWLDLEIEAVPEGRYFLEVSYFNRQGEQIGFDILRRNQGEIRYPEEAFTYVLTLKSAGASQLLFKGISIYSMEEHKPFKLDKPLEKRFLPDQIPDDLRLVQKLLKTM
ncbi:accessory Sec system protein Asp3 [Streptococcus sp. 121]|uniref:accessory Sec system protein Asp3 n=1 Tax=Streptococcus sp. 121 TaxID=2797637 RepID=UPI0018F096A4|nr:accessory Sec system protein Asp3 [Streptococcus sp. 121]MBJ6746277.1 accessory Sec system protein Asp3 [Streptococcus sp. 121]